MTDIAIPNKQLHGAAQLRRRIANMPRIEGKRAVAELLANPDEIAARMRLGELLGSIYRQSERTNIRLIQDLHMDEWVLHRRLGPLPTQPPTEQLTPSQRFRIASVLTNG